MSTLKVNDIEEATVGGGRIWPARAWANVNQIGTQSIRADENISSITDSGTGDTEFTFAVQPPNANYAAPSSAGDADAGAGAERGTPSSCTIPPNSKPRKRPVR